MSEPAVRTIKTGLVLCCPPEWSTAQIAQACGCSRWAVCDIYRRFGMRRPRKYPVGPLTEQREFEIRYGVSSRFWRVHKLETMKACHETARDYYVRTYKERKEKK